MVANKDKKACNPDLTGQDLWIQDVSYVVSKNKDCKQPLEALLVSQRSFVSLNVKNAKAV